jgi:hypothetical protein
LVFQCFRSFSLQPLLDTMLSRVARTSVRQIWVLLLWLKRDEIIFSLNFRRHSCVWIFPPM